MDFAEARRRMVDGQIRPNRVTDPVLLRALEEVPRERFVPRSLLPRALADEDLPLGGGRVLLQPMTIARLLQLAEPRWGERALVVAAGPGYGAALLARLGLSVTAVEEEEALLGIAARALAEAGAGGGVRLLRGPLAEGHAAGAPYDLILLEGAVPAVPAALEAQLAEGGRLVALRVPEGEAGSAVVGRRIGGAVAYREAFDARSRLIPAFRTAPSFRFV